MSEDKIRITIRVNESFYNIIAKAATRRGLTIATFSRYVLKKYFNEYDRQKANPNR